MESRKAFGYVMFYNTSGGTSLTVGCFLPAFGQAEINW